MRSSIQKSLTLVLAVRTGSKYSFNGGMSASNRWTLLLYLPLAMTVMIFLRDLTLEGFSPKMIRLLATSTGIYLVYLAVVFFIQNDDKLFLPVIFLLLALGLTYLISENKVKQGQKAFANLIILNVCLNAAYAALPYNGRFASAMLNRGEYGQIAEKRYGGLEEKAAAGNYRINTVSNNKIVSRKKVWNDLTSNLANISSYYSIQNAYLGQFSTDMQNIQYDNNIPLHQVDDPDDGFFRIAGEAVGRIRRTSPRQQPVPDPEHFWDPPVVPVQEEPAPDEGQFWDLPDLTVQEEPALETEPSAPPAEKKSALPSEDEIRAYMASFARGDYSDMDAGQSAPYREPEIDPRFLTKADYAQGPDVMMYGDNETDISAG